MQTYSTALEEQKTGQSAKPVSTAVPPACWLAIAKPTNSVAAPSGSTAAGCVCHLGGLLLRCRCAKNLLVGRGQEQTRDCQRQEPSRSRLTCTRVLSNPLEMAMAIRGPSHRDFAVFGLLTMSKTLQSHHDKSARGPSERGGQYQHRIKQAHWLQHRHQ